MIQSSKSIQSSSVAEDEEVAVANTLQSMHRRSAKVAPAETQTQSCTGSVVAVAKTES